MANPDLFSRMEFGQLMVVHFAVMCLNIGLTAFYMVHALTKNRALVEQNHRILWALLLFVGNLLAMPIYFVMYIFPDSAAPVSNR